MERWSRAWHELTGPPHEAARDEKQRRVRARYLQRLRRRRVWHQRFRRLRWIDQGKPPFTVLRWLSILGIALAWWAQGAATSPPHAWVPFVVIAGALILPDVAGFAVGSFRVDLKRAQDEIATLRQEANAQARASSTSILAVGDSAIASVTEDIVRGVVPVVVGQASGDPVPWTRSAGSAPVQIDSPSGQDVTS